MLRHTLETAVDVEINVTSRMKELSPETVVLFNNVGSLDAYREEEREAAATRQKGKARAK